MNDLILILNLFLFYCRERWMVCKSANRGTQRGQPIGSGTNFIRASQRGTKHCDQNGKVARTTGATSITR